MRALEATAIASGKVTALELMERAGQVVVTAIQEQWPDLEKSLHPEYFKTKDGTASRPSALVLCGPGNNGGDGFVVARLLKQRGWRVRVYLYGDPDKLPPDARTNYDRLLPEPSPFETWEPKTLDCDLLVDALFGIGLSRPLDALSELFVRIAGVMRRPDNEANHLTAHPVVVAIDVPSGLCADTGRILKQTQKVGPFSTCAHLTVTFQFAKTGHLLSEGPTVCGTLVVKTIGL